MAKSQPRTQMRRLLSIITCLHKKRYTILKLAEMHEVHRGTLFRDMRIIKDFFNVKKKGTKYYI